MGSPCSPVLRSPGTLSHGQLTPSFTRPRQDLPGVLAPLCTQPKPLAPGPFSHILPAPWSQAATSPPPSEVAGNAGAWLGEAPGSCRHGSLHSANGLKGLRARAVGVAGPAGLLWSKARWPFPPRPGQWDARRPGEPVDREQGLNWPHSFLPAVPKGRALGLRRWPFLGKGKLLVARVLGGVWTCSTDSVPPGACLE